MRQRLRGEYGDTLYDFGNGVKRKMGSLDEAIYTDENGISQNSTDAWYKNKLAESAMNETRAQHAQIMKKKRGGAGAMEGNVYDVSGPRQRGGLGGIAKALSDENQRRYERKIGLADRAADTATRQADIADRTARVTENKLRAETSYKLKAAEALLSVDQQFALEKMKMKDQGYQYLYKEMMGKTDPDEKKAAGEALTAYTLDLTWKVLKEAVPAKNSIIPFMSEPPQDEVIGLGPRNVQ